jgi:hypothetical protein
MEPVSVMPVVESVNGSRKLPIFVTIGYALLAIQMILGLLGLGAIWWTVSSTIIHMQTDIAAISLAQAKLERQVDMDRATNAANSANLANKLNSISETLIRIDTQLGDLRAPNNKK